MLKVLHVFKSYFPETYGGIEEVIHELCCHTVSQGGEAYVLAVGHRTETFYTDEGYCVHRCKGSRWMKIMPFSWRAIIEYKNLVNQVDVIHYHYPYPFSDFLHLFYGKSKPSIVTYHSDLVKRFYIPQIYRPLRNRFLSKVDAIVATSENYLKSSETLKMFVDKTSVIPIGIDSSRYDLEYSGVEQKWREQFAGDFFLFLGALRSYKGLEYLVNAAALIDSTIVIAGDGPERSKILAQIKRHKLQNVYVVGAVSHIQKGELFRACRAVILPSNQRSEAFGISLIEGAMYGKPLVSCELATGTSFVNKDGYTGFVVKPNSSQEIADAIKTLSSDNDLAERYGSNARQRYEKLFDSKVMATNYYSIYREII